MATKKQRQMSRKRAASILGKLGAAACNAKGVTEKQRQARRLNAAKATAARMAQREADAARVAGLVP